LSLLASSFLLAGAAQVLAQDNPTPAQVVVLDECEPASFNAALGPDFCKNVTLGAFTTLSDLFAKAAAGTPDPNWDFEPDVLHIKKGTPVLVVDPGRRTSHLHRGQTLRWRLYSRTQFRRSNRFRMFRRF
jgi:hypothetical protein